MLVMGLDTALQRCSVAIIRDGEVVSDKFADMERGHAEHLAPMAAAALKEAQLKVAEFDRIGVVVGPGGFTGVRIALSFARGLAIGTDVDVVGVTSLAALALKVEAPLVAPVIDARRGQLYAGLYEQSGKCMLEPFVAEPKQVLEVLADRIGGKPLSLVGSGAALLPTTPEDWRLSSASTQIEGVAVARLAAAAASPRHRPRPLYLRPPDAKPPKPGPITMQPKV